VSSELNLTAKDWQEQLYCHIMTVAVLKVEHLGEPRVREVASGVDALYLSGRAALPPSLVERLENARTEAVALDARPPFQFGALKMLMAPHAFGKYHYSLSHPYGRIGITPSPNLPTFRIQPRAEFLHGVGPRAVAQGFRDLIEDECGFVKLQVSRIDLFADFQGWELSGDDRSAFVCRASGLGTFEDNGTLTGLQFGKRTSGTVDARLYNKTIEILSSGAKYWKDIWGDRYDPSRDVLRVEFEVLRSALREFGLDDPDDVLDATGALWAYLTTWLSYRVPTGDHTRSRWPVAPEWEDVRHAQIGEGAFGIERTYRGKQRGELGKMMPALVGYLARFGALSDSRSDTEMLEVLEVF
jgi:hypothetical protein